MIEVGNIITLENGVEYLVLEELFRTTGRYVYIVRVNPDETPTQEFEIYEAVNAPEGEFIKPIDKNEELYNTLTEEFKDIIQDKIISGAYDNVEEVA